MKTIFVISEESGRLPPLTFDRHRAAGRALRRLSQQYPSDTFLLFKFPALPQFVVNARAKATQAIQDPALRALNAKRKSNARGYQKRKGEIK